MDKQAEYFKTGINDALRRIALRQCQSPEGHCKGCNRIAHSFDLSHGFCGLCSDYKENWK